MKKQADKLSKGDRINLGDELATIIKIEFSDIGKHGKRKARLELKTEKGEKLIIIRPADFMFDII